MNIQERSLQLLKRSRSEVISDPSWVKELTDIFRLRGEQICSACPGVLSGKYDELKTLINSGNFNNIFMAKKAEETKAAKPRRYMLPHGKTYRPMGMGVVYTNDNLTDDIVEKLIKLNPSTKKVFIDLNEQKEKPAKSTDQLSIAELKAKYKELTGSDAPETLNNAADLLDVIKELEEKK